jgi:tetratricopeptide (TPR) repeat protein
LALWIGLAGGCASRQPPSLADRFIRHAEGPQNSAATFDLSERPAVKAPVLPPGLVAEPIPKTSELPSVEGMDIPLRAALADLAGQPSGAAHRRVAEQYWRLSVFDAAFAHFTSALDVDHRDAAAYEGLARVWRDEGFLAQSLTEASRAVYYAPAWAQGHNTLGTVLFAIGEELAAEQQFAAASALDPTAAYVRNNLCYLSFRRGDLTRALEECREALKLAPDLAAARLNLEAVTAATRK